ncbi:MAG: hypothetical protein HY683_06885, partial [Chloroflexi bacterium]|nr:hypothetical protein [Chloroflexota bacterium]
MLDADTQKPVKDEKGNIVFERTAGINGTMCDVIRAVQGSGATIMHVIDGIETIDIDR